MGHLGVPGKRLDGRVALISGAGSVGDFLGTGAATAVLFGAHGAVVGVLDLDADRAERTRQLVEEAGGTAHCLVADVTDESAVQLAVDEFAAATGRIDIVVTNTGVTLSADGVDNTAARWARVLAINLTGTMVVAHAAHPHLVAAGGGSLVTVSSIAAVRGFGNSAYAASKGGVIALTTDLAYAWGSHGIRVNCLVPGHLHTPLGSSEGGSEAERTMKRRGNLLGTEGTAWDLAWAALFFAGPESRWITGAVLPIDAGASASTGLALLGRLTGPEPVGHVSPGYR